MGTKKLRELTPEKLRSECDPSVFDFENTDEISPKEEMIGQERALKAIDFGLNIKNEGFNLYISGIAGTGRNTTIIKAVEEIARKETVPEDICYLYNFEKPDEPKALTLPPGKGCDLQHDMEEFAEELESGIRKAFLSEEYEKHRKAIIDRFEETKEKLDSELDNFAASKGFELQQTLTGTAVIPVSGGKPLTEEEYEKLSNGERSQLKKSQDEVYKKLYDVSVKVRELQREIRNEMRKLDEEIGLYAIGHLIDELKKKYAENDFIKKHLDDIKEDILKNLDAFKKEPEGREFSFLAEGLSKETILNKYKINLLVDNCKTKGAPVVVEHNPTYYNLTGYVEYRAQFGVLVTDFTMIKAGSVHKANGGYLILQAHELLKDYFAWEYLKKVIRYKKVKIENLAERYGFAPTTGLKPQAVPVDVKVIIVGNPLFYHLLYIYDEDFSKLFKVKADFDTSLNKTEDIVRLYAHFIALKCKAENLLTFKKDAIAKVIDYGTRLSSNKEKLTARFVEIVDLLRETDYWARREGAKAVGAFHVKKALDEKVYRSNMIDKKIEEMIKDNTILIDTDGRQVGQINGISVIDLGDYAFGKPSRITARTFVGKGNIINIEREAEMSGRIHSKGVLILSGYLGQKFAQDKPLALSASICFEQLYEEVEGDSASSAELYCLLSGIGEIPLRQDIAVTGSVDQRGRVQPVSAINEKIEGFYEVCKIKGLTGGQGVIIPESNVRHLMLKDEVVEAVREKKFHIYPVETIEEGIAILTGMEAGKARPDGRYPKGTVYYKVNERLAAYAKVAVQWGRKNK